MKDIGLYRYPSLIDWDYEKKSCYADRLRNSSPKDYMKTILFIFIVTLNSWAHARACKVFGISDGPQQLTCTFFKEIVKLTCVKGNYLLNDQKVLQAFHLEVEEGDSPLVFKAQDLTLTVVGTAGKFQSELQKKEGPVSGPCL
jgi:hypothetical protein